MPYPSILSLSILTKTISLFLLLICAYKRCSLFRMGHYHCMMEKSCQATNFYLLCRSLGIVGQVWNIFAGKDPPENIWKIFLELWYTSEGLDHLRIYLLIIVDWKHEFVCNICTYLGNIFCVMWNMFGGFWDICKIYLPQISKRIHLKYIWGIFLVLSTTVGIHKPKDMLGLCFECDLNIFEEFGPSAEYTHLPKKIHHI